MIKNFYSVRDTKASAFQAPFIAETDLIAIRMLTGAMIGEQTLLSQFPADFELFQIGSYDTALAKTTNLDAPKFIISCASIQLSLLKASQLPNLSKSDVLKKSEAQ